MLVARRAPSATHVFALAARFASSVLCSSSASAACLASLACLASACGTSRSIAEEERVTGRSTLGATTLELVVARNGVDVAFGQGPGRGGFLDPAHSVRNMRAYVRVLDGDRARRDDFSTYDAYVAQRLLAEKTWDTNADTDALDLWERAWREAALERCDAPDAIAVRVRPGAGLRTRWARARRDASGAVTLRASTDAPDCAAVRALLDVD